MSRVPPAPLFSAGVSPKFTLNTCAQGALFYVQLRHLCCPRLSPSQGALSAALSASGPRRERPRPLRMWGSRLCSHSGLCVAPHLPRTARELGGQPPNTPCRLGTREDRPPAPGPDFALRYRIKLHLPRCSFAARLIFLDFFNTKVLLHADAGIGASRRQLVIPQARACGRYIKSRGRGSRAGDGRS